MEKKETNAYILGTEKAELHRLGIQHQVWSSEAIKGWEIAGFKSGDTILDLGCGPGFCTMELSYLVGEKGKVIGVDLSEGYISFLDRNIELHGLNVETQNCFFDDMVLEPESLDGMYCRWAMAWVPNPQEVLNKVKNALKPGGRMVIQEYFDWKTFQTEPPLLHLNKSIAACLQSFHDMAGNINVGRELISIGEKLGLKIMNTRPMTKLVRPSDFAWEWPDTFFRIYPEKLIETGYLTRDEFEKSVKDLNQLKANPNALIFCPYMIEIVLEK